MRALPSSAHVSVGAAPAAPRKSHVQAGLLPGEVGMHSNGDLHCWPRGVHTLAKNLRVGDSLGCGVLFDPSGKEEQCIYFTLNGQVLVTVPHAVNGAPLHPLIAVAGKGVRLEVALGLPLPAAAAQFLRRILVEGPGCVSARALQ